MNIIYCPLGGIGRRKGLKIPCPKGRPGSSPGVGTKFFHNFVTDLSYLVVEYKSIFNISSLILNFSQLLALLIHCS